MNEDKQTVSEQTLPLRVVFNALKVISESDLINGLDDWRMSTEKSSLSDIDKDLAALIRRQPPTKYGHADDPSLWTSTHFYLALPALFYALNKYGKEDQATASIILSEEQTSSHFNNFPAIVDHFREYQEMVRQFGEPTIEWWDNILKTAFMDLGRRVELPDDLVRLPSFLALKAQRVLRNEEDSLSGRIVLAYLLNIGYTPEEINLNPRILHYLGPIGSFPPKTLYKRLVDTQGIFVSVRPFLEDYDPTHELSVGKFLSVVEWFGNPQVVEVVSPEYRGADEPTILPLISLLEKLVHDGAPDYTSPPLSVLPVQKFLDSQSLSQIGRLSITKDILSTDHHDLEDGAILRRFAKHLYSPSERLAAWGDESYYLPDSQCKRTTFALFKQDIANILYCSGVFIENENIPEKLDASPIKRLATEIKQASTIDDVNRVIKMNEQVIKTVLSDWQKRYPSHERLKLLSFVLESFDPSRITSDTNS